MFDLPIPNDGAKLRSMVGAIIYIRVSTKEQTENLSLPTQLRVCEEYCRREGFEILERFKEEGESAKTTAGVNARGCSRHLIVGGASQTRYLILTSNTSRARRPGVHPKI